MNKRKSTDEVVDEWPLGYENPARRALREAGVTHLKQLTRFSEMELLKMHGVGPKAIRLLRDALAQRGLAFAQPDRPSTARQASKKSL